MALVCTDLSVLIKLQPLGEGSYSDYASQHGRRFGASTGAQQHSIESTSGHSAVGHSITIHSSTSGSRDGCSEARPRGFANCNPLCIAAEEGCVHLNDPWSQGPWALASTSLGDTFRNVVSVNIELAQISLCEAGCPKTSLYDV